MLVLLCSNVFRSSDFCSDVYFASVYSSAFDFLRLKFYLSVTLVLNVFPFDAVLSQKREAYNPPKVHFVLSLESH
jgi:hypothetical protein